MNSKVTEDNIQEKYQNMGISERRRVFKANKHKFPDMSFKEWNENLPHQKRVQDWWKK